MVSGSWRRWRSLAALGAAGVLWGATSRLDVAAQEQLPAPATSAPSASLEVPVAPLTGSARARALPINLPTALQLANAQAVDIAAAAERIRIAAATLEQARVLWLPTITLGGDYARHDGRNQDTQGNVFDNSRSSVMFGAGTGIGSAAILNVSEALFAPLAARQQVGARQADERAASNDTLVAVQV